MFDLLFDVSIINKTRGDDIQARFLRLACANGILSSDQDQKRDRISLHRRVISLRGNYRTVFRASMENMVEEDSGSHHTMSTGDGEARNTESARHHRNEAPVIHCLIAVHVKHYRSHVSDLVFGGGSRQTRRFPSGRAHERSANVAAQLGLLPLNALK